MIQAIQKENNVVVISLEGTLDVGKQTNFKEDLLKNVLSESSRVVLDFRKVDFIDSACLGALVAITRQLRSKGGDVCLAGLISEVQSIIQITRLDKIFKVYDELDEALRSYAS